MIPISHISIIPRMLKPKFFVLSVMAMAWTAQANDLVVRVGLCSSLTGANASPGANARIGIQAMVDWVNDGNVSLRKGQRLKLELVDKGDDGSNVDVARQFYQELVNDPSVDFLISPFGSEAAVAVNPLAEAGRKLIFVLAATDSLFADRARWRVQVLPPASTVFDRLVGLLAQTHPEAQPMPQVLPAENDEFGRSVNSFIRSYVESHYPSNFSVLFDSGTTQCANVPGEDNPCYYPRAGGPAGALEAWVDNNLIPATPGSLNDVAVLSAGHNADGIRFAKKLDALGLNPTVLAMTVAPGSPAFFQNVGPYARGIIGNTSWHEPQEIYTAANTPEGFTYFGPTHAEASFRIRLLNGNKVPSYQAGNGGMAVLLLASAIQRADGIKSIEKVRQEVHRLKLQTCFGQYGVDEATGFQTVGRMLIVQWHTPDDDASLTQPTLRVIAAPPSLETVVLSPFIFPKP